ncbi:MAG: DNA repair protein RecN [Candidatus Abyssobacteria bacterium SURF_17]|uniref:DNA repair protein RecN n=1 Tax=Candidatus Abyssobacteria bacterium SURF_17 TaxID=2093361 RepID=A0A419F047_9BACT|nr:MAG: DNA repair protein RecN [Candidatus Abyssubacteria bacterium SURF_17]
MLETLHIRNFALIDDLIIPWKYGLNVLTGETGAGKSIIVDAMGLLLGERASTTFIRKDADSADIEALFDITDCTHVKQLLESMELDGSQDEVVLRRVIIPEGKSRCFLNGTVVTLNLLSQIGDLIVDIHGQHEHQSLLHPARHLTLLDEFSGLGADVAYVRQGYRDLKDRISALERVRAREASRNERVTELEEELALLDQADLREGEDEEIKTRRNVIAHSEKIHRLASEAYDMLSGGEMHPEPLVNTWGAIMQALQEIAEVDPSLKETLAPYEELRFKLDELGSMLQAYAARLEYDPGELDALEKRLEVISRLKRRHGCESLPELIAFRDRMRDEYDRLTGSSNERVKLERGLAQLRETMGKTAIVLSQKRSEAANRFEKKIQLHLRDLGMTNARFVVSVQQEETPDGPVTYKDKHWRLWSTGIDAVEFLFSANVGEPPRPLKAVASGGELSRVMLAIRTIVAHTDKVPVIIFDEIDTGVDANVGMRIAEKLASVASSQQVICVTHRAEIAAMADNHIVVDKQVVSGRTRTEVSFPAGNERVREIARMVGGDSGHANLVKYAQELLAFSRKGK